MKRIALLTLLAAGITLAHADIRINGFHSESNTCDQTQFRCWMEGERVKFRFEVVDDTVCAAPTVNYKRDLENYDRVEVFFAPTAELLKRYCCVEIDPKGRVLDYRATFYRFMDYEWSSKTLKTHGEMTATGYIVEASIAASELEAQGIDLNDFHYGAFRADYAPGARLVNWYSSHPADGEPADFHRPFMFSPASLGVSHKVGAVYHVDAEKGGDHGDGSVERPFKTPVQARDAVRRLKAAGKFPTGGVAIELSGEFAATAGSLLDLTTRDSGLSSLSPVIWRASQSGARLVGAKRLKASSFKPVPSASAIAKRLRPAARDKVRVCDLAEAGVARFKPLAANFTRWPGPELICDGKAMKLARYPNRGWMTFAKAVDRGVKPSEDLNREEFDLGVRGGSFIADDRRALDWVNAKDAYFMGFWCWDWFSEFVKVGKINPETRLVTMGAPSRFGFGHAAKWQKSKIRYYALNLPEELDEPGEWWIDRDAHQLYFWPLREDFGEVSLAINPAPLIKGKDLAHVRFENLTFRDSCGLAVAMDDCRDLALNALDAAWLTTDAIRLSKVTQCAVTNCKLAEIGAHGLLMSGGDRRTLTKSGNLVKGNDFGFIGRLSRNDGFAVVLGGCGTTFEHNYLHDAPYILMRYDGNEHLIQYNTIECAMLEAGDGGGVYTGRDWGSRGNVVRWNFFNCFGQDGVTLRARQGRPSDCEPLTGDRLVEGLYLDDCDSGDEIYGNIFYRVGSAMFTGGGRDNLWHHNLVIGCHSAVFMDTRGLERAKPGVCPQNDWDLLARLERMHFREEPWRSRYPELLNVMENEPLLPIGTSYHDNIAIGCETFLNCQSLGYGVMRLVLKNYNNVTVSQLDKERDLLEYPQFDKASRDRLRFMEDAELSALALKDPLKVQDSPLFRKHFPDFPHIPIVSKSRQ